MRIGEFAKEHGLSIDTVRFYVNEGLLIPMKDGYHYSFDEQCAQDMYHILSLKNAGFSLQEIKTLILSENLSTYAQKDWQEQCRTMFLKKHEEIGQTISQLSRAQSFIEERLSRLEHPPESPAPFGIDLSLLPLLSCPHCGGSLSLQSTMIEQNQVLSGTLTCTSCRHTLQIRDGILIADASEVAYRSFTSYDHFITQADPNLMASILQNVRWMRRYLYKKHTPGQVILELGSGFGFFLRNTLDLIPEDAVYIAIDYDSNRHLFLKQALQTCSCRKNINLICCNLDNMPLKPGIADQIIDFGTATDLAWYRPVFTLELADRYAHANTSCLFAGRAYERFHFDSPVKPEFRKYLEEKNILSKIEELNYRIVQKEKLDFLDRLLPANQFMNGEDVVYKVLLYLEKKGG